MKNARTGQIHLPQKEKKIFSDRYFGSSVDGGLPVDARASTCLRGMYVKKKNERGSSSNFDSAKLNQIQSNPARASVFGKNRNVSSACITA